MMFEWEVLDIGLDILFFLQNGTPVDTRDKYFKTPLMAAAAAGNFEITKYLLSLG